MNDSDPNSLCLECGLCCNGVIFGDVQLRPEDDALKLEAFGLKFLPNRKSPIGNRKFRQPCSAFECSRCRIYPDRPTYCRDFECLLLKSVKAGQTDAVKARRVIRSALRRVQKVKRLLKDLGDTDETVALSKRFRRMKRKFESTSFDAQTAQKFGKLTLAVHDLNLFLGESFYNE